MKKKVLAALLAVCMILSTCVLYASAVEVDLGSLLVVKNGNSYTKVKSGSNYQQEVTMSKKKDPGDLSASVGSSLTAEEIDKLYEFKTKTNTVKYQNVLEKYLTVETTVSKAGGAATVEVTNISSKAGGVYRVKDDVKKEASNEEDALKQLTDKDVTELTDSDITELNEFLYLATNERSEYKNLKIENISLAQTLNTLKVGVRFFGKGYDNLVANELAKVTIYVKRQGQEQIKAVTNEVVDLMINDEVILETQLKDVKNQKFYDLNCWVNGSGKVIQAKGEPKLVSSGVKDDNGNMIMTKIYSYRFPITGNTEVYANYVEIRDRHTISFSCEGEGAIVYADGEKSIANREVFTGDGQVSVLDGRDAYFTFTPKEGYEVAHVYVDEEKDVTSFLTLVTSGNILDALQELIKAGTVTTEGVKASGTYTFKAVDQDHTIHVVFQKAQVLDAPSGKDLPTVAAEGITLATGADAENGDGENGGATTVPAEDGAAANGGSAASGVVNPATGSTGAIAVFATLSVAACAAFVTAKKKED